ncbi:SusD/RagB family nutrient-binding outer membrane lipoprotein [Snuella sedimenti]|uniref:SusD/RagB family nutrient-binding outer membrane lipoprotein n=1 Tax=Snuella sedimenti TaxID=2798802 RepID=A0A8J7IXB4_9FLAO|nr:SusD/RagB family nutrient-binding outer membrane lipoprotein [Snuella sedimenti]MBJ6368935.1 SusD/RagB family nutrient-binding outer membrane lipoprotein [Snuella sedimenti]
MKTIKYIKILLLIFVFSGLHSCLDYEELRENPNQPTSVPPSLLFAGLTPDVSTSFTDAYIRMQYHIWVSTDSEYNINFRSGFGGSFGGYSSLRDIEKMNEAADANNAPIYRILGKFYAARAYIEMTRRMGDIPFSQALSGSQVPRPVYDAQKQVYIGTLDMLDDANNELGDFIADNQGYTIDGDVYYGGQLVKWQKLINAYTLRILVSLSKRANDSELNVKGRFANIVNNPSQYPLFESIADNAELTFRNEDGFKQTYNPDVAVYRQSVNYASTYLEMLKEYQDPRLFLVADPTQFALDEDPGNEAGVRADFDSYVGADPTVSPADNITLRLEGKFSLPNEDKYWNFVGQPGVWLSYWEQEFCIAEAAHRGWISANAKEHYDNAVKGSMLWYGVDEGTINSYLSASSSSYISGDEGLTRLLEQKYLAFAENSGDESFFNFRRSGVPDLPFSSFNVGVDPGYPKRWSYPGSENSDNPDNYLAALNRQFGIESDDIDFEIWEIKD